MSKLSLREIAQSQLDSTPVIDGQLIVCLDTGNAYRDTAMAHVKIGSDLEVVSDLPLAPLAEKLYYLKPDKLYVFLGGNWTLLNDKTIDLDKAIAKLPAGSSTSLNDDVEIIAQDTDITQPHYYRRKLVVLWEYIKTKAQDFFAAKNHKHGKADITDFPTSMPASDVYPWAKAATKPSYTKAEVGLGKVDNTADADKTVKRATTAGTADSANSVTWENVKNKPTAFPVEAHTHDDRYYTEAEVDRKLNEKLHEASYQGDLNDLTTTGLYHLYGTNTNVPANGNATVYVDFNVGTPYQVWTYDVNGTTYRRTRSSGSWTSWTQLSFTDTKDWASITGKPSTFPPETHTHDDRYYTESEMDGKLNSKVNNNEAGANGLFSKLGIWTATPTDDTYFIRQDTGGGNTFGRVKFSTIWNYIKGKTDSIYQPKGSYSTTDTKNTAGSTNTTSKLYLIGATSQSANPQTYSNASVYTTGGALAADGIGKDGYIAYPGGGFFTSHDSFVTGYCKIILPVGYTNTMMSFTVTIYDYVSNESVDYKISGYNYSDNKTWYNPTAVCVGKAGASHSNLTVRFGDNGSNVAIAIGESTTRWDYPQVVVHDVLLGFNDYSFNSFKSGWSIVFNNQDTPNVSQTISNTHVGYNAVTSWDKIQNKPSSFTPASHTHDDRYYTEAEIDGKLSGKSNTDHTHDDRYYTESEIDSKLSGKANSNHTHYSITTIADNRNTNTTPNDYNDTLIFQGLKFNDKINSPSSDTYSYLLGLRGWCDSSGGNSHELAFNNTGVYWRNGGTTSWNGWNRIYTDNYHPMADVANSVDWSKVQNKPSSYPPASHTHAYLPLSGGTMSGALNFANNTWNPVGDDVQIGDHNTSGSFYIQGLNGPTNIKLKKYGDASEGSGDSATITYNGGDLIIDKTIQANLNGKATTAGSANSLSGLSSRSSQGWGVQTGTFVHGEGDSTGGGFAFRRDCPNAGQLSMVIDGRFYQNEGQYMCLDANNYSNYALPLSGGTLSGNIHFADIGSVGTSSGITWDGSTDGAGIYYQTTSADQGNLVLNLTDDNNCYLRIAQNGNFKSYFSPNDGNFHGNVNGTADVANFAKETYINQYKTVNLTDLDQNTWYPVTGTAVQGNGLRHFKCSVQLNSGSKPSWSTHSAGFTAVVDILEESSGWGTTGMLGEVLINDQRFIADESKPPVGYQQMNFGSIPVWWLRGGGSYRLATDYDCTWTIRKSKYENNGQSVAPTTTYPGVSVNRATITANLNGHANTSEIATVGVRDCDNVNNTIKIGWSGASLDSNTLAYVAGYTSDKKIRTASKDGVRSWLGLGNAAYKNIRSLSNVGPSGWANQSTDDGYVPTMAFMAFWNGAFNGSGNSNLQYCDRGRFGTIVTKNSGDYAIAGHTHNSVNDIGSGKSTTFAYSKAGMNYGDYSWLAGWNGYELRAVNKSQFATAGHTHVLLNHQGNVTAISGTAARTAGLQLYGAYNNGYPMSYGNVICASNGAFGSEIALDCVGGDGKRGPGRMYYRNRSNWGTSEWSDWATVAYLTDKVAGANHADNATTSNGVKDYNDANRTINIGFAGAGLSTSNLTHIAGYTDNGTKIKDVSKDVLTNWIGLGNYLPLSGGTMSGQIKRDVGCSWINDRDSAIVYGTSSGTGSGYHPVVGQKTPSGAWTIGTYGDERLIFDYTKDTDKKAGTNNGTQVYLPAQAGTIITSATIGSQSVNRAEYLANDSAYMRMHWSGQDGQPTWLWGGNDKNNMYVWNPSNFSVKYANSAGSATIAWNGVETSGSNYIRFKCGVQICWKANVAIDAYGSTYTFQAAFSAIPAITAIGCQDLDDVFFIRNITKTNFIGDKKGYLNGNVSWIAVGVWK